MTEFKVVLGAQDGKSYQKLVKSPECGFPMRKGIQQPRKRVLISGGVGFLGLMRDGSKQKGLVKRRTICGEMITKIIHQVNLKVTKAGSQALAELGVDGTKKD